MVSGATDAKLMIVCGIVIKPTKNFQNVNYSPILFSLNGNNCKYAKSASDFGAIVKVHQQ